MKYFRTFVECRRRDGATKTLASNAYCNAEEYAIAIKELAYDIWILKLKPAETWKSEFRFQKQPVTEK